MVTIKWKDVALERVFLFLYVYSTRPRVLYVRPISPLCAKKENAFTTEHVLFFCFGSDIL